MKRLPDRESWRSIVGRLWPYTRSHRGSLVLGLVTLLSITLFRLLEPWPLKIVFDSVLQVRKSTRLPFDIPELVASPRALLLLSCLALLAFTGIRAGAQFLNQVEFTRIGNQVLTRLRADLFDHVQRLHLGFHRKARSGDLILRVIQDVNFLRDVAVTALLPLAANILVLAGMWGVMFWMNWQLALVAAATLPLLALHTSRLTERIRDASRRQRLRQGTLASTAAESIGAIQEVQALSLEGSFSRQFARDNQESGNDDVSSARASAGLSRSVDVVFALANAIVLGVGSLFVLESRLSAGDLLVFLTYLRRAFNPVQDFAKYTGRMSKAASAAERIFDLFDQVPEVRDRPDARDAPRFAGAIEFRGVSFAYEPGREVFRDFDLSIPAGQSVALIGASGAGKTTFLRLLLRLYDPDVGAVTIDGHDLREFKLTSLRARVATVQQEPLLFAMTIEENIALGSASGDASREEVERAARVADAHAFVTALPQGYETTLGERGVTLSGGQRQRIAVARAAVRDAPIVMLDEPTTGLDEESRVALLAALSRLTAGRTTIVISHDLELARSADRIVYLEHGRLVEDGSPAELLAKGGRYATLYRLQTEGFFDAAAEGGRARSDARV